MNTQDMKRKRGISFRLLAQITCPILCGGSTKFVDDLQRVVMSSYGQGYDTIILPFASEICWQLLIYRYCCPRVLEYFALLALRDRGLLAAVRETWKVGTRL